MRCPRLASKVDVCAGTGIECTAQPEFFGLPCVYGRADRAGRAEVLRRAVPVDGRYAARGRVDKVSARCDRLEDVWPVLVREPAGLPVVAARVSVTTGAEALARDVALLALDEVQVHDVADALILHRLFDSLWKAGVSTVFTSNAAPSQLYERGISYGYFLPFVVGLHERCSVVKVGSATTEGKPLDYRRTLDAAGRLDGGVPKTQSAYFAGPNARALLDTAWKDAMKKLALTEDASPSALPVAFGRTLRISRGASGKIARFSFQELCGWRKGDALSAGDYMELVQAHEAIYVANVPLLTNKKRDAAARFVRLVDCAYDQGTALVVAAAGSPDDLFAALLDAEKYDDDEEETPVTEEERSSFRRAASRLVELGRATRRK